MGRLRTVVLMLLFCVLACSPAAPSKLDPKAHACVDAKGCEAALLTADAPAIAKLLASHAAVTGDDGWLEVFASLKKSTTKVPFVGAHAEHEGTVRIRTPPTPKTVATEELLLALARHTGRDHVLFADKTRTMQLFPQDVLAPHMLGLVPVVSLSAKDPSGVANAIALAAEVRDVMTAASAFRYVDAARGVDALRELIRKTPQGDEGAMRARLAVWLLDTAGIALASDGPASDGPAAGAPREEDGGDNRSSAYAEFVAVQLSRPAHAEAWEKRKHRIMPAIRADRHRALSHMYAPDDGCPSAFAPPIEHPSDVAFASLLAVALDTDAAPGVAPAPGKLTMEAWLARYDALVRLVEESGIAWSALGSLLRQRGELFGLTAEGTGAYKRVTELALKHVAALTELANAEPARLETLSVVSLVYQPGVLSDPRLRPAVAKLVRHTVGRRIATAQDAGSLFDAALASFAAGMSFPAALQGAQFEALGSALEARLGKRDGWVGGGGWSVAGLHAANAMLRGVLGHDDAIADGAERVQAALRDDTVQPALARLAGAAAAYAQLGTDGALDASVSNPAMFTAARSKARRRLGQALTALTPAGPTTAPEKQLHQELTDLTDLTIAAVTNHRRARAKAKPRERIQCAGQSAIPSKSDLRDAFDRLHKKRKAMFEGHAFSKKSHDSAWIRRARVAALLVSDVIDAVDQRGGVLHFTVDASRAEAIVEAGLKGWIDGAGAELASGLYFVIRAGVDPSSDDDGDTGAIAMRGARRTVRALGVLFGGTDGSLFKTLAELGDDATSYADIGELVTGYARRAYRSESPDHGDLLLMVRLAADVVRGNDVAPVAVDLAKAHGRSVYLPLLMFSRSGAQQKAALRTAMQKAGGHCSAPPVKAVLAVDAAIAKFKAGERDGALRSLTSVLDDAESHGLAVPRQVFRFEQHEGKKVFKAEQSVSFGHGLLRGSSAFHLGLGFQSREVTEGTMTSSFADPKSAEAGAEAARYYAHVAALAAAYAFAADRDTDAVLFARRAIGVWIHGARLGRQRVFVENNSAEWARDATATLVVTGQLAADRGQALLASDLWTLARASLDPASSDTNIAALLDPLPPMFAGVNEAHPAVARAKKNLTILAMSLPCTDKNGAVADLVRVRCERYPVALALRGADALSVLPRLKKAGSKQTGCVGWAKLDRFLGGLDEGLYDPKRLVTAVTSLVADERHHDAASVLTRHRHPDHCNPALVSLARTLGKRPELGMHLRADLLTIATNCAPPDEVAADLLALDALTQKHAMPNRQFETLLFATRLALKHGEWEPLADMSKREGFIQDYNALGPEFGVAALLVHHAAAVGAGRAIDVDATLPFYRLLCTTFPPKDRSATCHAVSVIRGDGAAADKKRAAARALSDFLQRGARSLQPAAPAAPP